MKIQRFERKERYHNVIIFNDILYLSGQTATDAGDTIKIQAEATLKKIEDILNQYGSKKENILHADVYLKDEKYVPVFNEVWDKWIIKGCEPTRACIIADLGRASILTEVVVTAVID